MASAELQRNALVRTRNEWKSAAKAATLAHDKHEPSTISSKFETWAHSEQNKKENNTEKLTMA